MNKGAFGEAMMVISQDQMIKEFVQGDDDALVAQPDGHAASLSENKSKKKYRLNQIVQAAYRGKNSIKPSMEAEEIAHQYHMLKIEHNELKAQGHQQKTKVRSLQHDLNNSYRDIKSLTDELHRVTQDNRIATAAATESQSSLHQLPVSSQALQLKKHSSNQQNVYDSVMIQSLKKQVRELREENEQLKQDQDELKKSTKVCVYNELDAQLEIYSAECSRLRDLLEQTMQSQMEQQVQMQGLIQSGQVLIPPLQSNAQTDISAGDKAKVEEAFYVKEVEIQGLRMQQAQLLEELQQEKERAQELATENASRQRTPTKKIQGLQQRQTQSQSIIKQKNTLIVQLKDQLKQVQEKSVHEKDKVAAKNVELSSQIKRLKVEAQKNHDKKSGKSSKPSTAPDPVGVDGNPESAKNQPAASAQSLAEPQNKDIRKYLPHAGENPPIEAKNGNAKTGVVAVGGEAAEEQKEEQAKKGESEDEDYSQKGFELDLDSER